MDGSALVTKWFSTRMAISSSEIASRSVRSHSSAELTASDSLILDRPQELIKVKGNQVAPAEIEGHLLGHPDVADAAVIGVPDDFAGELPMAYIVLHAKIAAEVRHDTSKLAAVHSSIFKVCILLSTIYARRPLTLS